MIQFIPGLILVLLPFIGISQSKTSSGVHTDEENMEEILKPFSAASDFFFATLKENFGGVSEGDNIHRLMQIFSMNRAEPEDFFRLQVNAKKFEALNEILEPVYDAYFPYHMYIYERDSKSKFVRENIIMNKLRDTVIDTIPTNASYAARNSFVEGMFKRSFDARLLSDKTDSKVKEELRPLLEHFLRHSALEFSHTFPKRHSRAQLIEIFTIEYNRILTSLVFWEYLADCANYDLNTRKYFYEE